ncbi:hypothetical protein lerEdw1_000423 [Lerista edwardsae]|nr:hypothetical protein lerEdw1_000423 [Lerista edwardsae]
MEQWDLFHCLDLSQGKLRRFLFLASLACLTTDWQDNLTCYYIEKMGILECSWLLLPTTSDSIVYTVFFKWSAYQYCKKTLPPVALQRSWFRPDARVTVWASASDSPESCTITKNISFVPNKTKKCPSPSYIKAYQLLNTLTIMWDSPRDLLQYELQIRERTPATSQWIRVPVENGIVNMTVSNVNASSTYVARLRCKPQGKSCSVCVWSRDILIPHKLTEKPKILENSMEEISKGKRSIFLKWETTQKRNTIGYYINVERVPAYCGEAQTSLNITKDWLRLNLSMAYYRINVSAYNEEGTSPPVTYMVPEFTAAALPGQIKVLKQGNDTVISWNLTSTLTYFAIDWGTGIEDMRTTVILTSRRNFRRVPRSGPANVTLPVVTKHSALVKWTEIPVAESLGFLQGYRLHYTEILKNLSLTVTVKSTTHQYLLTELTPKTHYRVQISGITSMGEGALSLPQLFTTLKYGPGEFEQYIIGLCLGIVLTMTAAATLCALIVKRIRKQCWPEVPNPRYSSAIQHLDKTIPWDHLGLSLLPLLQPQLSSGATDIHVVEHCSKTPLPSQESLSQDAAEDVFTVHSETGVGNNVGTTPNPLKILAKGNANKKAKAAFPSDYTSVEVSHRAMQRVSTNLPTTSSHL